MNPCTSGCPQANLIQGTLSNMASVANAYDPQPPLPSASSTIGNSTNNNSSHGSSTSSPPSMSTAAIVGIAVGGSALVLFVVAIVWWWRRRLQYRKRESSALNPVFSFQTGLNNDKTSNYRGRSRSTLINFSHHTLTRILDTSSEASYSAQSTPLPVYDFHEQQQQCPTPQHQQTVHEADPANQVRQSPNFASPTSSYTFSPGMSNVVSPSYYPQPPSELVGDSGTNQHSQSEQQQLTSLGLQSFNATNPTPAELGDSKRGTGDGRGQQKVAVGRWWVASTVDVWSSCSVIRIYAHLFGSI